MKYLSHILSLLGIVIFYFLGKTYKSKGFGDITPIFFYAGMLICCVSLIVSFFAPTSFNVFKKIVLGLLIGIVSLGLLVSAISVYDKFSTNKRLEQREIAIKKQKKQYEKINVLSDFQFKKIGDSSNSPHQKTVLFHIEIKEDSLVKNWNIRIFGFLKTDKHKSLLDLKVLQSDVVPLKGALKITARLTENTLQLDRLQSSNKLEQPLDYIVLLTNPKEKYSTLKLNEGIAYTSLSQEDLSEKKSVLKFMQSRNYHIFHHPKLKTGQKLYGSDFLYK